MGRNAIQPLRDDDLPALHTSADAASLSGQNRFLRATIVSLACLAIAAFAGALTIRLSNSADLAGIVAGVAFSIALLTRLYLLTVKPDRQWYEGRAAAESVKTLAWRYAVKGEPFVADLSQEHADALFIQRINETLTDLKDIDLEPSSSGIQITSAMKTIRAGSFDERRSSYEAGRIADQYDWYSKKSGYFSKRAHRLNLLTLGAEAAGIVGATLKATSVFDFDTLGVAAAVAAGFTAWDQARQHNVQATAYGITAQELASIRSLIPNIRSDADWASFVDEAEEAISREHQLWRASHGVRRIGSRPRLSAEPTE